LADERLHIDVHLRSGQLASPDAGLDAVIDFVAHAASDIPRLVAKIWRVRGQSS
jgi:hypothetical protein